MKANAAVRTLLSGALAIFMANGIAQAQAQLHAERISQNSQGAPGDGHSSIGTISDDGRFSVFHSTARNLAPGDFDDEFDQHYVYVRDRLTNDTDWLVQPADRQWTINTPTISRNGSYAVFISSQYSYVPGDTPDLDIFRKNLGTSEILRVNQPPNGGNSNGYVDQPSSVSADGRIVAFVSTGSDLAPNDTNGVADVFVRDMANASIERINLTPDGNQFGSDSEQPAMSGDGRYVVFWSAGIAAGQQPGANTQVYLRDRQLGLTQRISIGVAGSEPNAGSGYGDMTPSVSDDGRWILFGSRASNLVYQDTNNSKDLFLADRQAQTITRVSLGLEGQQLSSDIGWSAMSADGRRIIYTQPTGQINEPIYWFDRTSGTRAIVNIDAANAVRGRAAWAPMAISGNGDFLLVTGNDELLGQTSDGNADVIMFDLRTITRLFANGFE